MLYKIVVLQSEYKREKDKLQNNIAETLTIGGFENETVKNHEY